MVLFVCFGVCLSLSACTYAQDAHRGQKRAPGPPKLVTGALWVLGTELQFSLKRAASAVNHRSISSYSVLKFLLMYFVL